MSKFVTNHLVEGNLLEHPAVRAWFEVGSRRVAPTEVVVLKEHKSHPWRKKSAVYRLKGVGPGGSAVIAKRCKQDTAVTERAIYENVLPIAGVPALTYHGYVEEQDSDFCWLFLEDAQGIEFSNTTEEHRTAAARWLGQLHGSTHQLEQAASLPARGPEHYLEHLESGYDRLVHIVGNPALKASDAEILRALVGDLELLRSHWSQIARFCSDIPSALAHGDFVAKNIRVRTSSVGLAMVPFDWEASGWGPLAIDLGAGANPELGVYWAVIREVWSNLDLRVVQQVALVGSVFRLTAAIDWECASYSPKWLERTMWSMVKYQAQLRSSLEIAPWND